MVGSVIGYIICAALKYSTSSYTQDAFGICVLASCMTYSAVLLCYVVFQFKFKRFDRAFKSPLQYYGAVLGICIFGLVFIGAAFFQDDNYQSLVWFIVICIMFAVYYYLVASRSEFFSPEEQKVLFAMYIANSKCLVLYLYIVIYYNLCVIICR